MEAAKGIVELIGNTPLVRVNRLVSNGAELYAKLEYLNPGGSVKDRIGISMINVAVDRGLLRKGMTIIEPTSGNTGIGLLLAAIQFGYNMAFTVPDKQSKEKINLLKAYGGLVVVTRTDVEPGDARSYYKVAEILRNVINHEKTPPGHERLGSIVDNIQKLVKEDNEKELKRLLETPGKYNNAFIPNQYSNMANPLAHYRTTGPEIWRQTGGKLDAFVCGMGTGGTISGAGRFLKEKNPEIKVIGVDTEGSILHHHFYGTEGKAYPYKIEGIGEDFIPETTDFGVVDEIITVGDREAYETAGELARKEGILTGSSGGAAMLGAMRVCKRMGKGIVVVLLPDGGRNYLSKLYNDEWMRANFP